MKDIEIEEKQLRTFITISVLLDKLYLTQLSLFDPELKIIYEHRLAHLAKIKAVFLTWMSDYKLKNNLVKAS